MTTWLWVGVAWAGDPCADADAVTARSAEIQAVYDAGEAERVDRSADTSSVLKRDEARVKQMVAWDKKGELCTPDDQWHAAWVMTQADKMDTIERAYALAQATMDAFHPNGAWLVAYTFDLKRVRGGYRQSYGTQTRVNERNQRCLIEIEPDVTDAERAQYGQKPLADVYRSILDLNGFPTDEPTLDRVERRGLSCPAVALSKRDQRRIVPPDET
ncbi:MAG: hypothetical protein ABMB14_16120 [Myxococcota bacterium]